MPKANKATLARVKYANAQVDESEARSSTPEAIHENVPAALEAKAEAVKAMDELHKLSLAGKEDTVTLTGPNDRVNVTDANGIRFVNGKAEGVPKSVADFYVNELEGYSVLAGK